jgi:hypothetical protein
MSLPPPRKVGATSIALLAVVTVAMVLVAIRHDRLLKPGQTLQFDDFFFALKSATRSERTVVDGNGASPAHVRYIVTLTVENRAKRVPFRFSDQALAIIDRREGQRFYVDSAAQKEHQSVMGTHLPDPVVLRAGESATKDYVFVVPADVVAPRMRIAPGGWFGLAIDRLLTGTKEFELP